MLKTKLHNPIIANNSHIENAVVEKVTLVTEKVFSDLVNVTPVVPETGRMWYNTETGTFKFANNGIGLDNKSFVDEFLSKTDLRDQSIFGKVYFKDSITVKHKNGTDILFVDSQNGALSVTTNDVNIVVLNTLNTKIGKTFNLTDSNNNNKISANNSNNTFSLNYSSILINGMSEKHTLSDNFVINDGITDKFVIDNTNNKCSISYSTIEETSTETTLHITDKLTLTNGSNTKILANNTTNELNITFANTNITGNAVVDGNMVVTGDLTVGGQTTKVNITSENMVVADNIILLNSNLTDQVDPRLASALVDGMDVDHNAGISINRGSQGVVDLIKWVESTNTSSNETLKEATTRISIWNYEAVTPSYELHQIIDTYTLGRQIIDKSGTHLVGYDGFNGVNYQSTINVGATEAEASDYTFKIVAGKLDTVVDTLVQEIDTIKYNTFNTVRVGETPTAGNEFTITHNLETVFIDVRIQREEDGNWFFDIFPIQVIDANTVKIVSSETTKIRYMISAIQGFDVNQATDLVIN